MGIVLEAKGLHKSFDGVKAISDFSCSVQRNEILGLIGPNGAGKTTFFNIVSGFLFPDNGKIIFDGENIVGMPAYEITNSGISRTFQNLRLIRQMTVIDNVLLSLQKQSGEELHRIFFSWHNCRKQEIDSRNEAMKLLEDAGIAEKANDFAEELSYGQQKLLSLVCCLATKSDVMLLDEPVAGIAPEMIDRILTIIKGLPGKDKSAIIIEHNLDAIIQVCDRVIFMDAGAKISEGTPEEVRDDPRVIEAYID